MAPDKIIVQNLTKIFGPHPREALKLLEKGMGKDEIFRKTRHTVGVKEASFTVKEGEILVVMGLSGSGKSTLVRMINRLIDPTAGKVIIDGEDITDLSPEALRAVRQHKLGMVFQNFALFPHRTVLQNVVYGLEIQGVPLPERSERGKKALEQVGLGGQEDSYPAQLSGGMQQRVGLARALALDPAIMLMDEAFSALDPLIRRDMQDELLALQEKVQKTIVFISHDLDEALKLGDRIILMKDGVIVQEGTGEEILTNPANEYVAKFVEDVDMSKVLTAESVMMKPREVAHLKTDGPRAALRKMHHNSISSIFVQKDGRLQGVVFADAASEALKRGEKRLESILVRDICKVSPDTPAVDLFAPLAEISYPLPVVNDADRLLGVVIKGALLAGLSERGVN